MDSIYSIYVCFFLLMVAGFTIRILTPRIKGAVGERTVNRVLKRLNPDRYTVLSNLILESTGGSTKTTQIDHVVVSVYGIFSVETKNYKGQIYGNEMAKQWTQNIYGHKYKFENPIRQNYAHIKALEAILMEKGFRNIPIYSIVTFPRNTEIKVTIEKENVVKYGAVARKIRKLSKTEVFTQEEKTEIAEVLQKANVASRETTKAHIKDIRHVKAENRRKIARGICPKCGGTLMRVRGKYGVFYGCSNYPQCRFTTTEK